MIDQVLIFFLFSDMPLFGLCPAQDEFYLVVCETCKQVVKPQALLRHMGKERAVFSNQSLLLAPFDRALSAGLLLFWYSRERLLWQVPAQSCAFFSFCVISNQQSHCLENFELQIQA